MQIRETIVRHLQQPVKISDSITYILPPTVFVKKRGLETTQFNRDEQVNMDEQDSFKASRTILAPSPEEVRSKAIPAIVEENIGLSAAELNDLIHHKTSALLAHLKPRYFVLENGSKCQEYTIINKLGEGAHAKIYKASNHYKRRPCAVKVLNFYETSALMKEDLFRNFRFEYQVGQIDSDYLIQSYEKGFINGNPFIVSEYADGGDLNSLMRDQLSLDMINKIALDILKGLSDLHGRGLIHRDLKPHNIFLTQQTFKIGDFGVSTSTNTEKTSKDQLQAYNRVGTYGYMAPELFSTFEGVITSKNDLFSFGCLMFQIITGGVLPFGQIKNESDIENYIYNSKNAVFRSLRSYRKDLPRYWEDILFQCLQPDPNDRYNSAEELIESLLHSAAKPTDHSVTADIQQQYIYDLYFSFAEADKLWAIEIFSFLDNKGLKVCMSNHLFDLESDQKEEKSLYEQSKHFLALYSTHYIADDRVQKELDAFIAIRKESHQRVILYDAVIGEMPDFNKTEHYSVAKSKKEILNNLGIGELFDQRHPLPEVPNTIHHKEQEVKGEILAYIAQNQLKKAIGLFFEYLDENDPDNDAISSLSVLSSRYKSLERDRVQGITSFEALKIEENKLILGLNKLVLDFFK